MQKPPICTAETPMPEDIPWEEKQKWIHPETDPVDREARMGSATEQMLKTGKVTSLYEWIPDVECRYCGKGYSIIKEN